MWLGVGGRCDQCRRRTVGEQRQNVHAVQHHLATTLLFGPETTFKHENPKSQLNSAFKPIGWLREPPVANLYKHISCKNGRAVGGHYISISLSSHHHLRAIGSKRVKVEIWMCFWGVMCVIVSVIWEENLKPTSSQAPTNWALAITGPHPSPKCPGSWKSTNIQWWQWCDVASWCLLDTCRRSCAMILNLKLHTFQQQNTCEKKIQGTWSRINLGFSPRTNII
jgi:hypothetical protein